METTIRLELALQKVYNAFYKGTLNPECNNHCAVGNICDNKDSWKHLSDDHGSLKLNYVGLVHQNLGRKFAGYTPLELLQIEAEFLKGCGYKLPLNYKNLKPKTSKSRENLFEGMLSAVACLCALDGLPNVMDVSHLLIQKQKNSMSQKMNFVA